MKRVKYRIPGFAFYDRSAIQAHLEKMAAAGWLVERPGNFLWRYRRIEPKRLHFAVTYFPNASDFDPAPTDGQRRLEEYCARDGWIPAAQWGQMQIFYHEGAQPPTPIETDAVTQVETICRAMRRNMMPAHLLMSALCLYQLGFMGRQCLSDPAAFLSSPLSLYLLPMWLLILLASLYELCFYLRWHRRARALAEGGVFLELKTRRAQSWILLAAAVFMLILAFGGSSAGRLGALLWGVLVLPIVWITRAFKEWFKKRGASRNVNRALSAALSAVLTVALLCGMTAAIIRYGLPDGRAPVGEYEKYGLTRKVYADALPLRMEDLTQAANDAWSLERKQEETVLLSQTEYRQWPLTQDPTAPELEYTVTEVKAALLYELCKSGLLRDDNEVVDGVVVLRDEYHPTDAAPWRANAAYRLYFSGGYLNRYLLCYQNRIVEISFDWEPIPEQMAMVAEKLGTEQKAG